jgi:hypothetical protein
MCRLIACMSTQIRSNLRDESIKPNYFKIKIFSSNKTKVLQCSLNFNSTNQTPLRAPLDHRNSKGKVEDSHSYGFEHCSTVWNVGLRHMRSEGNFPMLQVS